MGRLVNLSAQIPVSSFPFWVCLAVSLTFLLKFHVTCLCNKYNNNYYYLL